MTIAPWEDRVAKDDFYVLVGATIREARRAAGLTPRSLAARARLGMSTVNNAESGQSCSLFVLVRIAEALDTSLDALVPTEATP